jgi:hypothetical protein
MKIRITQTGLREFRDVYEFNLTDEQYAELKQNLRNEGRTLADFYESDAYDLGFELDTPVETELGDIVEDEAEAELIRTKKKVVEETAS